MHPKSAEFCAVLDAMRAMHLAKSSDYGTADDPLANLRASDEFGIEPWHATLVRMNDKITRLKTFAKKRSLRNEGFEDTLIDLACYSILVLMLYRETLQPSGRDDDSGDDLRDGGISLDLVPRAVVAADSDS